MTSIKTLLLLSFSFLLINCGNGNQTNDQDVNNSLSTKALKDGFKTLSNLKEMEKEIMSEEEKRNKHNISGYFKGTLNGKTINLNQWDASISRGSLFPNKLAHTFNINEHETLTFMFQGKDLYDGNIKTHYVPTMIPYKVMDKDFMNRFQEGFASVAYSNKDTGETWSSADGQIIIEVISPTALKARWKGEAFLGNWREKNLTAFEGEANLMFNFVSDLRNIQ